MSRSNRKDKKDKKDKKDYFDYLKVKLLKVKDLCARNIKTSTLNAEDATFNTVNSTTLSATNIIVDGNDLNCLLSKPSVRINANPLTLLDTDICFGPTGSSELLKPPTVAQEVWDALLVNACKELNGPYEPLETIPPCIQWAIAEASISGPNLTISSFYFGTPSDIIIDQSFISGTGVTGAAVIGGAGNNWTIDVSQNVASTRICFSTGLPVGEDQPQGLRARLQCGREFINSFLACKNCPRPCPSCPEDPTSTEPCPVPMFISAIQTLPVFTLSPSCGPTGSVGNRQLLLAVNYDINVNYELEIAESTDARVVSVLCQVGYVNFAGEMVIQIIDIGNKQFYPTLDVCHGEKYTGQINIPTAIIQEAVNAMPDVNDTGAVQLVIYKEKGVNITIGDSCENQTPSGFRGFNILSDFPGSFTSMVADEPNVQRFTATTTIDPTSGTVGTSVTIQYFVTDATPNLPLPADFQITGVRFGRYGQAQFTEQSLSLIHI